MSIHGASQIRCIACDTQVQLIEARNEWWICSTCGSYMCPNCRAIFLKTEQGICSGTIVRGVEAHQPHFTRFLPSRGEETSPLEEEHSRVVILGDVQRQNNTTPKGKVIVFKDEELNENR